MTRKTPRKASGSPASAKSDPGEGGGSTKLEAVERDAKGRIVSGALNAGGLTSAQRQARDAMALWLCEEPQIEKGKEAYLRALSEGNAVIIKDWMDRILGKPKESVELSGEVKASVEHDVRAEVVQSPQRIARIVRVLEESGALALAKLEAETAEPESEKP